MSNRETWKIDRRAAIESLAKQMPESYTLDGSHLADEEIFKAQEVYADSIKTIEQLPAAQSGHKTITKKEAIEKIKKMTYKDDFRTFVDSLNLSRDDYKTMMEYIDEIPGAQPERKKGKWIVATWVNVNTGEMRKGRYCSVCKCGYFHYDVSVNTVSDIPNYCPNCGADMRGGEME